MNILVTGATGFVGRALCKTLLDHNFNVTAVVRSANATVNCSKLLVANFDNKTDWQKELQSVDAIVHLAGRAHVLEETSKNPYDEYAKVNIDVTRFLAEQAVLANVKKFIFLSSIKVNGEKTDNNAYTEESAPSPEDDYGKTKFQAELAIKEVTLGKPMQYVIIRPPLIYGLGVKANFKKLIQISLLKLPLPLGAIHNKRSFIYIGNLIHFIQHCLHHTEAANETYLISDDYDLSTTDLIKGIANAKRQKNWLIPIPKQWIITCLKLLGKHGIAERLCGNLQVDITKAKECLNWVPPYTFKQGIHHTVQKSSNNA